MRSASSTLPHLALSACVFVPTILAQGEWTTDHLPSGPRWQTSVHAFAGKVFFAGGYNPDHELEFDSVDVYDLFSRAWSVGHLSVARSAPAVTAVSGRIFFAGGGGPHTHTDAVDIYESSTGEWTLAALSQSRSQLAAAAVGDSALFAGGWISGSGPSATVDLYDGQTDTWSVAQLSQARYGLASTQTARYALFAGGVRNGPGSSLSDVVDVYDSATGTWLTLTLPEAKSGIMAESYGDLVFFAGGRTDQTSCTATGASDRVDILDTSTMTWSQGPPLSEPRGFGATAVVGHRVLFVGGWADGARSSFMDVLDADTGQWSVEMVPQGHAFEWSGAGIGNRAFFPVLPGTDVCSSDTVDWVDVVAYHPEIGSQYCTANPNSTDLPGVQLVLGDTIVLHNQVRLRAEQLPPSQWGYFLMSPEAGFVPNFGGSMGNLCLGSPIVRVIDPSGFGVLFTGSEGEVSLDLDLSDLPGGTKVVAGDTWHFQFWFRDVVGADFTSNTTNAVALTLE